MNLLLAKKERGVKVYGTHSLLFEFVYSNTTYSVEMSWEFLNSLSSVISVWDPHTGKLAGGLSLDQRQ